MWPLEPPTPKTHRADTHADRCPCAPTLHSEKTGGGRAQPSAVGFHGPKQSWVYELRRVVILISMAPCHRKLLVCVPWGATLSVRIMPTVAATEAGFCQRLAVCQALR